MKYIELRRIYKIYKNLEGKLPLSKFMRYICIFIKIANKEKEQKKFTLSFIKKDLTEKEIKLIKRTWNEAKKLPQTTHKN